MNKHARSKPTILTTQKQSNRLRIKRWLLTSTLIIFSAVGVSLAGRLFSNGVPGAGATAQDDGISPQALAQIEALLNEKGSRAGTQQKMDSQLIYALKMQRGEMIAEGVQTLATDLTYASPDKVRLDLKANVTEALLNQLKAYGANIVGSVPNDNTVRIEVLLEKVDAIAELPDVMFIGREQEAMTSRVVKAVQDGPQQVVTDLEPGFDSRAARVRSLVSASLLDEPLTNVCH